MPITATGMISITWYLIVTLLTSNITSPPDPKSPHSPELHISIKALSTTTTTAVLKNVLQRRALHHVATSSREKRTPPTGARKAAQTPEEAPQVIRSRRSLSLLK